MKNVKILFITPTQEILIANFYNNFYEAYQTAKALQNSVKTEGYDYWIEYYDKTTKTLRRTRNF